MDFKKKVVVVTGGAQGIGRCIADEFQKAGATVCVIDKQPGNHFVGDIADKQVLERFIKEVIEKYGHLDFLINNALPLMKGIDECSYEEFQYAMSVGVTAPFYLTKTLSASLRRRCCHREYFVIARSHESTSNGELHCCQGWYCLSHPWYGSQPGW